MGSTVKTTFVPNKAGQQALLHGRKVYDKLNDDQRKAVASAKSIVPVDQGDLRDGIKGYVTEGPKGPVARVIGTNFKTLWFEKGSSKVRARNMIRGSIERLGYRIERKDRG